MKPYPLLTLLLVILASNPASAADGTPPALTGIEPSYFDNQTRAQDDFYQHVNGKWLAQTTIPDDKSSWGAFAELRENTLPQLQRLIERAAATPADEASTDSRKIADLYASYMDQAGIEARGLQPLRAEFKRIDDLRNKRQLANLIAHFNRIGAAAPFDLGIHQDAKQSSRYIVDLAQSGLGLPDRDYYLKQDDARLRQIRAQYQLHVARMLALAGSADADAKAAQIVALETALASVQWTRVENRDPVKTYHLFEVQKLPQLTPAIDWRAYLRSAGVADKISDLVISQPSYFRALNQIVERTSLADWKIYFRWHLLSRYAPYLPSAFADAHFAFYSTVLNGIPQQEPRWKRAVRLVQRSIGEGLGQLYVADYFPPASKARMEQLVANLLAAYRQRIDTLDWMSDATKRQAQAKLATFRPKIGYPDKWRDYTRLVTRPDDLFGNVTRATEFETARNIAKLGQPIDREEWGMTPQTVNAYYNAERNEIVFPAAILQPPFFNPEADDAVNYGGIGAVIGHEISHGFDDKGSQYDGAGNLRDWWTADDHVRFATKTAALVKQYQAYSALPGYAVNGELTFGENIADNAGLAIAYHAYQLSLNGQAAPSIDGFSGAQRFYIGWAQVWRSKIREQQKIVLIKTDPHAPPEFRGNGALRNQPDFYRSFDVKEGDQMYLAPAQRVIIW